MLLLRRLLTKKQLWVARVFEAIFHNIGQILVVSGILTGAFTGLCALFLLARLDKIGQNAGPAN